ncbi:hypothetical protein shn_32260 (plasmid) [Shinella sp. HZN7]|nr:hypothetical protein shn_32260 [Shinella sp. HZN7]
MGSVGVRRLSAPGDPVLDRKTLLAKLRLVIFAHGRDARFSEMDPIIYLIIFLQQAGECRSAAFKAWIWLSWPGNSSPRV